MDKNKRLLEVKNLKTYFHTFRGVVKAVDGISFHVDEGEVLGIVGESGSGKSVTSFSLLKLIEPPGRVTADSILFSGEELTKKSEKEMTRVRGGDISMIFQDPMTSLNPLYTVRRQIEEMLELHEKRMSAAARKARALELLKMVGIPSPEERIDAYPHQFSGGMRQRVIIAIALAANPKLIIADEPTTALDVTIQAQILGLMNGLVRERGASLILITHDLAVVSQMSDRIQVMYCGKIVESGTRDDVIERSMHPYTVGLIRSIPRSGERRKRLDQIPGMVPSMTDLPNGCAFAPRCEHSSEVCLQKVPQPLEVSSGHIVACHMYAGEGLK